MPHPTPYLSAVAAPGIRSGVRESRADAPPGHARVSPTAAAAPLEHGVPGNRL